jgi:hypothetical protein
MKLSLFALATVSVAFLTFTLVRVDWIETAFGVNPDGGSGALEVLITVGLVAATLSAVFLVRRVWRWAFNRS